MPSKLVLPLFILGMLAWTLLWRLFVKYKGFSNGSLIRTSKNDVLSFYWGDKSEKIQLDPLLISWGCTDSTYLVESLYTFLCKSACTVSRFSSPFVGLLLGGGQKFYFLHPVFRGSGLDARAVCGLGEIASNTRVTSHWLAYGGNSIKKETDPFGRP